MAASGTLKGCAGELENFELDHTADEVGTSSPLVTIGAEFLAVCNSEIQSLVDYVASIFDFNSSSISDVAIVQHNTRAVPCLPYVGSMMLSPESLWMSEMNAVNSVLSLPGRSLSRPVAIQMREVGLPGVNTASAVCLAALIRAAHKMCDWMPLRERLLEAANNNLPMVNAVFKPWGEHWKQKNL